MKTWLNCSLGLILLGVLLLNACSNTLPGWSSAPPAQWVGEAPDGESNGHQTLSNNSALLSRETTPQASATPTRNRPATRTVSVEFLDTPTATQPPPTRTVTPLPSPTPGITLPIPTAAFQICSPLEVVERQDLPRVVSDGYRPPPKGSDERHPGVDFAYYHWKGKGRIEGSQVRAVLGGWVALSLENTYPLGSVVIIETENSALPGELKQALKIPEGQSLYHLYAHLELDSLQVRLGEYVDPCQVVGAVGLTGNTGAAHLHFENRYGPPGVSFPAFSAYLKTDLPEARANYRRWSTSGEFQHFDPMKLLLYGVTGAFTPTPSGKPPKPD